MLLGSLYIAPILHVHYTYLLPYFVPSVSPIGVAKKLLIDQGLFAPTLIVMFFPVVNLVEGHSFAKAKEDLRNKYWPTVTTNWMVWIPAGLLNFSIIPI